MPDTHCAALARRWFDEVWNERRDATVHELLASNSVAHLEGRDVRGPAEFLLVRTIFLAAFPDLRMRVEDTVSEGDRVAVRWLATGTHRGPLLGISPSGEPVAFRGMTWLRFAEGRIVEAWDAWNQGQVLAELRAAGAASLG